MAPSLEAFLSASPFAYHITTEENFERIQELRLLEPASRLLEVGCCARLLRQQRNLMTGVTIFDRRITLTDQSGLKPDKIALPKSFNFDDLIELMNRRVFFWAGDEDGPWPEGAKHFKLGLAVLRVRLGELVTANKTPPEFTDCVSGAPKITRGQRAVRGPKTFALAHVATFTPSKVREITFPGEVTLPNSTRVAWSLGGPWKPL